MTKEIVRRLTTTAKIKRSRKTSLHAKAYIAQLVHDRSMQATRYDDSTSTINNLEDDSKKQFIGWITMLEIEISAEFILIICLGCVTFRSKAHIGSRFLWAFCDSCFGRAKCTDAPCIDGSRDVR